LIRTILPRCEWKTAYDFAVMKTALLALGLFFAATSCSQAEDCLALSEAHDVFKLREVANAPGASEFCKGAAEIAAQRVDSGRKHLENFLRANPTGPGAYRAHELLLYGSLLTGQYKQILEENNALLRLKPSSEDAKQMLAISTAFARYPDQVVTHVEFSAVQADDGIPLTINGKPAVYGLDTGAELSVISEAEAKRFGMKVETTQSTMGDSGGLRVGARIANADDVVIGKMHLKHVAFLVLSDTQQPFSDIPEMQRGLIGIPVAIAMRAYSHDQHGHYTFGAKPNTRLNPAGNLLFDQANPVVQVSSGGKLLTFTLDTGSIETDLWPAFGKAFPELLAKGERENKSSTGVGGTVVRESTRLARIPFNIGGKDVTLAQGFVLDDTAANARLWSAGNLGNDLLNQADKVSIDFSSMTLTLQ
jgi:hypothetical protein